MIIDSFVMSYVQCTLHNIPKKQVPVPRGFMFQRDRLHQLHLEELQYRRTEEWP